MNPVPPRRRRVINRRTRHADVGATEGSLRDVERAYLQRVLAESSTLEEAARHLAINPATLWRKRKRWGLA
jgi:transcriptional regulator with PAS, ATPase and Fis domain